MNVCELSCVFYIVFFCKMAGQDLLSALKVTTHKGPTQKLKLILKLRNCYFLHGKYDFPLRNS
jgi:hypothetical protein